MVVSQDTGLFITFSSWGDTTCISDPSPDPKVSIVRDLIDISSQRISFNDNVVSLTDAYQHRGVEVRLDGDEIRSDDLKPVVINGKDES